MVSMFKMRVGVEILRFHRVALLLTLLLIPLLFCEKIMMEVDRAEDTPTSDEAFVPEIPSICQSKCNKSMASTETELYCTSKSHHGLELQHRCCQNVSSSDIVGIDLQECGLNRGEFAAGIKNLSHLIIISLQDNPIPKLEPSDFNHNTGIQYLSLPGKLKCPGGNDIWENTTTTNGSTLCLVELNPCTVHNITCPENSYCSPAGINMTYCFCDEGYHGYKCMKKGHFPFLSYGIGICVPTVVLCLILWISQRRYVKTKPKNT